MRRDCWFVADLGVLAERPVLLNPLALWLAVNGTRKRADTQVRPYGLERDAWQIARVAPAEREGTEYPGLPRANIISKGNAFPSLTATRERQPSPTGGRRYALARTDPP